MRKVERPETPIKQLDPPFISSQRSAVSKEGEVGKPRQRNKGGPGITMDKQGNFVTGREEEFLRSFREQDIEKDAVEKGQRTYVFA